ncbi:MAG TPA: Crp/Fnr family transcriptional regulator [Burkholderiaceae bacterium]|nr:Crp/Fnr family transcriptional regulator [Burkholderiaceae bacterium]
MIEPERLRRIAVWSRQLDGAAFERARSGTHERSYARGSCMFVEGERFDAWAGVVDGLVKLCRHSPEGKEITYTGVHAGGWFGEGSVLKDEVRRYEVVALRDTTLALLDRASFLWLFEHSAAFNRFLVGQLNERLGQFMGLLENDRLREPEARVARALASLFNPVLYPDAGAHLVISQEEVGLLAGVSRPVANQSLKALAQDGVLRVEYGGLTVLDLEQLRGYG